MGLARLLLPRVVGQRMGLARLLLPERRLLRVRTLRRLLVLLCRSAGLLPLRDTVQYRLADGSGELRDAAAACCRGLIDWDLSRNLRRRRGCSSELERVGGSGEGCGNSGRPFAKIACYF